MQIAAPLRQVQFLTFTKILKHSPPLEQNKNCAFGPSHLEDITLVPSSSLSYFAWTVPVTKCTGTYQFTFWIIWLQQIIVSICQLSHTATYIPFSQLIGMVTRAVSNTLSYDVLHSSLEEFIPMKECNRDFVLLNTHLCASFLFCAYTRMQASELCNFKLFWTTRLYTSVIVVMKIQAACINESLKY